MLERLFTSKNRVKVLGFLLFKKEESHIREISRELKISPSAVKREIDNFVSLGIVKIEKKRIALNKKCSFLGDLKNIFTKTDAVIYPIREAINKNKRIQYAFIFGSFARGDYRQESDIDLVIISEMKLSEAYDLLRRVENKINRDINPIVWTLKNLKKQKRSGFVRDIFKKGIIMVKGGEDEIREIVK